MADKNFRVKTGLQVPGVTSANFLSTDSNGTVAAGTTLPIANGGTGQTSANNALNALLPIQNGSTINYALESDGVNTSWQKLYNQTIKNNGTTVTPRGIVNIVGGTFTDDSVSDTTTLTIPTNYVSTDGGSTITASTGSTKGLIVKGATSQTANLQEWQDSTGAVLNRINSAGHLVASSRSVFGGATSIVSGMIVAAVSQEAGAVPFLARASASQTANLQEWQTSAGTVISSVNSSGHFATSRAYLSEANVGPDYTTGTQGYLKLGTYSTTKPQLTIRAIASQTANFVEWQNSSGTTLGFINAEGSIQSANRIISPGDFEARGNSFHGNAPFSGATVNITTRATTQVGAIIRGVASQSANLQEWQNSAGTLLASISSAGSAWFKIGARVSGNYGGSQALLVQNDQNIIGLTIKANTTQTANLTEWQDSAGTVLASLSASGNLMVQDLTVNGTTTTINSTTLTVDDKNIELASVSSPTDTTADGAGITIKGATDKTFNWVQSTASFTSSEPISAPAFKSAGTAVSSNITLSSGYRYFVDTTSARTLTLPVAPSVGDEIQIYDASNSALTNNITVASNSNKIQGSVQDLVIDSNAATVYLTYTGSTYGWAVN